MFQRDFCFSISIRLRRKKAVMFIIIRSRSFNFILFQRFIYFIFFFFFWRPAGLEQRRGWLDHVPLPHCSHSAGAGLIVAWHVRSLRWVLSRCPSPASAALSTGTGKLMVVNLSVDQGFLHSKIAHPHEVVQTYRGQHNGHGSL